MANFVRRGSRSSSPSNDRGGRGFVLPHIPTIQLKLDRFNYAFWKALVQSAIRAHALDDLISATATPPSPLLPSTADGNSSPNPEFVTWLRQDQYLVSWMLSSIGESMLGLVVRCRSAREIWSSLENHYQSQSKAQTMQYRVQLQTTKKGNMSVEDYFMKMRGLADQLAAIGKPLDDDELLMHIMAGFGSDYEALVVNTIHRSDSQNLHDVQLAFQAYETRLSQQHSSFLEHSANVAYRGGRSYGGSGRGYGGSGQGRGNRPNYGRVLLCQLCGRTGHVALKCFKRFDVHFTGQDVSNSLPSQSQNASPAAFLTNITSAAAGSGMTENSYMDANGNWCVDSGATTHITHDLNNLAVSEPYTGAEGLLVGNGNVIPISSVGSSQFPLQSSSSSSSAKSLLLNNILYVPQITKNLLSISQFTKDNNVLIEFHSDACFVKDKSTNKTLLKGSLCEGLYHLDLSSLQFLSKSQDPSAGFTALVSVVNNNSRMNKSVTDSVVNSSVNNSSQSDVSSFPIHSADLCTLQAQHLHHTFGHPSDFVLSRVCSHLKVPFSATQAPFCEACKLGKMHQKPHLSKPTSTSKAFELVHSDLWGPSHVLSRCGHRFYICFVDDFTRYTWIYPLSAKSDTLKTVTQFLAMVKTSFGASVLSFQSDWGGEFRPLVSHFQSLGIHFQHPCPYIHSQNGKVERKHQHIVDMGLTLLAHAHMPLDFWWEAFHTATHLINRLPTPVLNMSSPFQLLYHKAPDYSLLQPFGCAAFPYLRPYQQNKLQLRSEKCLFLGYSGCHRGYKCLSPSGRLYIADTVHFNINEFPYSTLFPPVPNVESPTYSESMAPSFIQRVLPVGSTVPSTPSTPSTPSPSTLIPDTDGVQTVLSSPPSPNHSPIFSSPSVSSSVPSTDSSSSSPSYSPPPVTQNLHSMVTRSKNGIFKPKSFLAESGTPSEPLSVDDALANPLWHKAMEAEHKALLDNETWVLVPYSPEMKVLSNKWVFRVKTFADGTLDKLKARLVARGFEQFAGIDFTETFSPVVKSTTIRLVFSLAAVRHWDIQQIDINNAFLNGDLEDTIYMDQPSGFVDGSYPSHVCKLKKSLYGLKQAPRAWYNKLKSSLLELGFTRSTSDFSLFYRSVRGSLVLILVYVDDILLTGDSNTEVLHIIEMLKTQFKLKHMGLVDYFLGIEVSKSASTYSLHQQKYVRELLDQSKMLDSHACATPMVAYPKLSKVSGEPFEETSLYRSIVGKLQYLTLTRPDIAFSVNKLSQFVQAPTTIHWAACRRLLKYLKGSSGLGLTFSPSTSFKLEGFCDADYAGCVDDSRSTGGHCIFLGGNLVIWNAKKQEVVSRSSAESEYRSLANLATDIVWLNSLCAELGLQVVAPHQLWCDNSSAISLASNPVFHSKTKHVEVDVHYIRERIAAKLVEVGYVPTEDNVADIFTKPLSESRFNMLRRKLKLEVLGTDHG